MPIEKPADPTLTISALDASGDELAFDLSLSPRGERTRAGGQPYEVTATWRGTEPVDAHILVETTVAAADPWWLIPGAFYGENRPVDCERRFPRFEIGANDPAGMVSDHWSFRADRSATPAVFVWGDNGGEALVATETSDVGLTGLGLAHDAQTSAATVHLVFPYREGPVTYYGSGTPREPMFETHRFEPGATVRLGFTHYSLSEDRHDYAPILREFHAAQIDEAPLAPWVDVATAAELTAEGLHTWHYDPDPGVLLETVGFDREINVDGKFVDRQAMHVGWVSGIPWAYALLANGRRVERSEYVAAAERVIDFICAELSPSGTFWGTWYRETGWAGSWMPIRDGLHARTLAEATLFLVRALQLEEGFGAEHPTWRAAVRSNLGVLVARQRADGNLGAAHNAYSGEVVQWSGAAGLTWIPAFLEAADLADGGREHAALGGVLPDGVGSDDLRSAAARAGEYYAKFVDAEFIHGAPEDVDLAPTSEDGYAAVMAYVALHRVTGEARWLDLAQRSADWMLTFRYSYNVDFDEQTFLGRYGFASRGADQASTSNQHLGAYGLVCTAEMIELSQACGDEYYAERAHETLACFRQFIARQDGDFNAYRGMVTERFYQTACFQPKGMMLTLSHAWCVGVTLLACEQQLGLTR